ncbi:MAG: hypothetical protein GWP08_15450 [Nitrospiraceae bacterium]|nr:hypothetical protein [Nitrospiraceae bacterium]
MEHKRWTCLVLAAIAAQALCSPGCQPKEGPFVPRDVIRPEPVYCFDTVGHIRGSKPFILGGTCCCTPRQELMDQYHADGICTNLTLQDLIRLYKEAGIKTALDHKWCNNLCRAGPHVVKGGHCMVPPTAGTDNFEEVRFGLKYVPASRANPKAKKQNAAQEKRGHEKDKQAADTENRPGQSP